MRCDAPTAALTVDDASRGTMHGHEATYDVLRATDLALEVVAVAGQDVNLLLFADNTVQQVDAAKTKE